MPTGNDNKALEQDVLKEILKTGLAKWRETMANRNCCIQANMSKYKRIAKLIENTIKNLSEQLDSSIDLGEKEFEEESLDVRDSLFLLLSTTLEFSPYQKNILNEIKSKFTDISTLKSFNTYLKDSLQREFPDKKTEILKNFEQAKKTLQGIIEESTTESQHLSVLYNFSFSELLDKDSQTGKYFRGEYKEEIIRQNVSNMGMGDM